MNSIRFPHIFGGNATAVNDSETKSKEASYETLELLLNTECGELLGDPDFGVKLKYYYFHQNNILLKDVLIDEIYTKIKMFCPQILIDRSNIMVTQDRNKILIQIIAKNNLDFTTNTYNLQLKTEDED